MCCIPDLCCGAPQVVRTLQRKYKKLHDLNILSDFQRLLLLHVEEKILPTDKGSDAHIVQCSDFKFFEKMEKNNADMDVTCKFNTYLEKASFRFLSHSVRISFKVCKKLLKVHIRPPKFFKKIKQDIKKRRIWCWFQNGWKSCKKCTYKKL